MRVAPLLLTLTLAGIVHHQGAAAQPAATPSVDLQQIASRARQEADAPALGLVVLHRDGQPQIAVDGVRIGRGDDAVTADDLWHWGSITKSFTATLIARLVEKKVVSWDDTIEMHLGKAAPDMLDAYRGVTLLHLVSHRSGMQANIPIPRFAEFGQHPEDPVADRLKWARLALSQEPKGPKEETYEYSNNGYIVAGAMLEAATGKSWETLMREEVFAPLGLNSAGFGAPGGESGDGQPRGHQGAANTPVPPDVDNPAALGPAGRIHMSLADMARYLHAHATRRADFLSAESFDRLHAPPFGGNYACGWVAITPDSRWHNGSNTMWYAEATFDRKTGAGAAVVVNDGNIGSVQPTVRGLLSRLMKGEN